MHISEWSHSLCIDFTVSNQFPLLVPCWRRDQSTERELFGASSGPRTSESAERAAGRLGLLLPTPMAPSVTLTDGADSRKARVLRPEVRSCSVSYLPSRWLEVGAGEV